MPLIILGLVACADPGTEPDPSTTSADPSIEELTAIPDIEPDADLAAQVPSEIKSSGITVATSADTPPLEYIADDNETLIGFDIDIARAIAAVLDVPVEFAPVGFDTIIPGLQSDRYTMALSSLGVTLARQEVVDFVSYYYGGQGFLASSDTDFPVDKLEDLCGHIVAISTGTSQQKILEEDNPTLCADAGLEPWTVQAFPDSNAALLSIQSDRTEVFYGSISVIRYQAEHTEGFRVAGVYTRVEVGAAFPKGSDLVPLAQQALQKLIDDGTYAEILDKWGLTGNGIETPEINSATS